MAGIQNFSNFEEDFLGAGVLSSSASDNQQAILVYDKSSAGTPTYVRGGVGGEATLTLDATSEEEIVLLYFGDNLDFDIDLVQSIRVRCKQGQASLGSSSDIIIGMASEKNDDWDTVAEGAAFRCIGGNDIVVESDDGVNNNDDVATGESLSNSYVDFYIDFAGGKSDVKFYVGGSRVASSTSFDMSNYSGGLQPYVQLRKSGGTDTDSLVVDYIVVESKR